MEIIGNFINIFLFFIIPNSILWVLLSVGLMSLASYTIFKVPSSFYSPFHTKFVSIRNVTLFYNFFCGTIIGLVYGIIPLLHHNGVINSIHIENPIDLLPYSLIVLLPTLVMLIILHKTANSIVKDFENYTQNTKL